MYALIATQPTVKGTSPMTWPKTACDEGQTANELAFFVPGAKAADAFRHPFRYAP